MLINFLTQWTGYLSYNWVIICIFTWELWSCYVWMLSKIISHTVLILPQYVSLIHKFNEINYCTIRFLYKARLLFGEKLDYQSFLAALSFNNFLPILFWSLLNHVRWSGFWVFQAPKFAISHVVPKNSSSLSAQMPKSVKCSSTQVLKHLKCPRVVQVKCLSALSA